MPTIILIMLSFLPVLQGRHINCPLVCKGRKTGEVVSTPHDDPDEDFVQIGPKHCYGMICVLSTHHYYIYTHEVPHSWSVTVHGTAHDGDNDCTDKLYLLEVGTSAVSMSSR